jgi:hypothetical protein
MRESKLYQWLIKLSTGEQNDFLRFTDFMGGKNRKELYQLLVLFLNMVVRGKSDVSREVFFSAWKKSEPYDANLLRKRMTALKQLLDEYLATREVLRKDTTRSIFLMRSLHHRGWGEYVQGAYKAAMAQLEEGEMDTQYFGSALEIEDNYLNTVMEVPRKKASPALQAALDYADLDFMVQKLRYACAAFNQDRIMGTNHNLGLLPKLLPHIAENESDFPPLVSMYYRIYRMLTEPEDARHFQMFKETLGTHALKLAKPLARELYKHAINHCIARINAGMPEFAVEIQQLYKATLATEILLTHGTIEAGELKNIVAVLLSTDNIEAAQSLLQEYGPRLNADADPTALIYNQARIHYHKGEYSQARKLCDLVIRDGRDAFYIADARVCLWKSSYELGDLDFSLAQYDAFRMFLGRVQNMSRHHLENYRQFAACFFALLRIRTKYPTGKNARRDAEFARLLTKIESSSPTTNMEWLSNKVKESIPR